MMSSSFMYREILSSVFVRFYLIFCDSMAIFLGVAILFLSSSTSYLLFGYFSGLFHIGIKFLYYLWAVFVWTTLVHIIWISLVPVYPVPWAALYILVKIIHKCSAYVTNLKKLLPDDIKIPNKVRIIRVWWVLKN